MENGEDFFVKYYNGSTYTTVATFVAGYGGQFTNNSFWVASIILTSSQVNFVSNAKFRIQCDASDNNDDIYVDAVTLTAYNSTALMNAGQEVMWNQFDRDVILAGVERLWQPSAYVGSFGELTSNAISAYVARWERAAGE